MAEGIVFDRRSARAIEDVVLRVLSSTRTRRGRTWIEPRVPASKDTSALAASIGIVKSPFAPQSFTNTTGDIFELSNFVKGFVLQVFLRGGKLTTDREDGQVEEVEAIGVAGSCGFNRGDVVVLHRATEDEDNELWIAQPWTVDAISGIRVDIAAMALQERRCGIWQDVHPLSQC